MTAAITLTTDFGAAGPFVAMMKAVLQRYAPQAPLIDLTHQVAPCDPGEAGFWIARSWAWFPAGSVHVAVVDPGVGTARAAIAFSTRGHFFVGPDNGLWSGVMHGGPVEAVLLQPGPLAAPTFHGRDLFAPAAARLAQGEPLALLGPAYSAMPRRVSGALPRHEGKTVVGEVIYVDRYGNLVTNFTPEVVPAYAVLEAESLEIGPVRGTFSDVPTGQLLAYIGSGGQIEIAVRDGSAARRLGLGVGGRVRARLG